MGEIDQAYTEHLGRCRCVIELIEPPTHDNGVTLDPQDCPGHEECPFCSGEACNQHRHDEPCECDTADRHGPPNGWEEPTDDPTTWSEPK